MSNSLKAVNDPKVLTLLLHVALSILKRSLQKMNIKPHVFQ